MTGAKSARAGAIGIGVLAMVTLMCPARALAQADGRFAGTVLDPTGASVVPGAIVTVKNERTGEERKVAANDQGRYVVPNLKPSAYTIRAAFSQFKPVEYIGLQLVAAQEFSLDLKLQPANSDDVMVLGRADVVDLSSARIGVNVGEREVLGLPVNGRQMSQLMLQAPGAQNR